MPTGIWDIEWLSANSQRRYPLAQNASAQDPTGTFTLPDDVLVDLAWTAHASDATDPTQFQLTSVAVFTQSVILAFGYAGRVVATLTIQAATHTPNHTYRIVGADSDFVDSTLFVTIGSLDSVLQQPAGHWVLNQNGRLEPSVVQPDLRGVTSIAIRNQDDVGSPIRGELELVAGANMRITSSSGSNGRTRVRFDAITGEGLVDSCECAGDQLGPPIRTINGIGPDAAGNFALVGDECIETEAIVNGVRLHDRCSQPCCGCAELEVVMTALNDLSNRSATLEGDAVRQESAMRELHDVILSSRISYNPNRLS